MILLEYNQSYCCHTACRIWGTFRFLLQALYASTIKQKLLFTRSWTNFSPFWTPLIAHKQKYIQCAKYTGSNYKTEIFWAGDENCQWTTMEHADCLWESSRSSDKLQRRRGGVGLFCQFSKYEKYEIGLRFVEIYWQQVLKFSWRWHRYCDFSC